MISINSLLSVKVINNTDTMNSKRTDGIGEDTTALQNFAKQIYSVINDSDFDSDEAKQKYEQKIDKKLKAGRPLTKKEIAYLKKNNPILYHYVKIIETKRKIVESQLKNCKSKEEVQRVQDISMQTIGKDNPIREMLISAVNYTIAEFKKTDCYNKLPQTNEDAKQNDKNCNNKLKTKKDKKIDESEGDEGVTLQYNFSFGSYQEAYVSDSCANETMNLLS